MKAPICKIIDFSTVDGIGCRSAIFFQGCNIHCLYCHNPETQEIIQEEEIPSIDKKEHPELKYMEVEEVLSCIKKNLPFIRGITCSGGECSLYPEFISELFSKAQELGLTTLLDSNGMILYEDYPEMMRYTDGVMLDIKAWDEKVYSRLTGKSNTIVKKNLSYLHKTHKIEELRIVYVPSYVDAKACLDGIKKELQADIKQIKVKLITFRNNGVKSILSTAPSPSREAMEELSSYASYLGFESVEIR